MNAIAFTMEALEWSDDSVPSTGKVEHGKWSSSENIDVDILKVSIQNLLINGKSI